MIDSDFPHLLARSTVFLTIAFLIIGGALRLLRIESPRTQAACWLLVLTQGVLLIGFPLPIGASVDHRLHDSASASGEAIRRKMDEPSPVGEQAASRGDAAAAPAAHLPLDIAPPPQPEESQSKAATIDSNPPRRFVWSWTAAATGVWLVGVVWLLLLSIVRYVVFVRSLSAESVTGDRARQWKALLSAAGFRKSVRLLTTQDGGVFCGWTPAGCYVAAPESLWTQLSPEERRSVLFHEIEHLRCHDLWTSLFARLVMILHWFNPAAWMAGRRFHAALETACDQHVVQRASPYDYVRALIHLGSPPGQVSLVKSAADGALAERIRRILFFSENPAASTRTYLVLAMALVLVFVAAARPQRRTTTPAAPVAGQQKDESNPGKASTPPGPQTASGANSDLPRGAHAWLGSRRFLHRYRVQQVRFFPDGDWIASVGNSIRPRVDIWNARDGSLIRSLIVRDEKWGWGESLAVAPDGRTILLGEATGYVSLFEVKTGRLLQRAKRHRRGVGAIAYNPSSRLAATGAEDGMVHLYKLDDLSKPINSWVTDEDAIEKFADASGYPGGHGVASVAFSQDGKTLLAATGGPATVFVLDIETGKRLKTIGNTHGGKDRNGLGPALQSVHALPGGMILTAGTRVIRRSELPPGKRATSLNVNITEIKLWDAKTGKLVRDVAKNRFEVGFGLVGVSPGGQTLAIGAFDQLQVEDLNMPKVRSVISLPGWWGRPPAIAPGGRVVAAPIGNAIRFWDIDGGQSRLHDVKRHSSLVQDVEWRGRFVATCGGAEVNLWDPDAGKLLRQFSIGGGGWVRACSFSADGARVALSGKAEDRTGRDFGMVQIWATEGEMSWTARTSADVRHVALSPDSNRIVGARTNGSLGDTRVELWEVAGRVLRKKGEFPPNPKPGLWDCEAMTFSKDGRYVWIAQSNGNIVRWDTAEKAKDHQFIADWRNLELERGGPQSGQPKKKEKRPWLSDAAFAISIGRVITTTRNQIYIWDLETGKLTKRIALDGVRKGVRLAVSPDGRRVAISEIIYAGEPGSDEIRIIDLENGKRVGVLHPPDDRAYSLAWSPDGARLVTGFTSGTAMVWNAP